MTQPATPHSSCLDLHSLTGIYAPPLSATFDDEEPRAWLEVENVNDSPRLLLTQVDLLDLSKESSAKKALATAEIALLLDDKLAVFHDEKLFVAPSMPLFAPHVMDPRKEVRDEVKALFSALTSSVGKVSSETEEPNDGNEPFRKESNALLKMLSPLFLLLPSRLFLVGMLSKKAIHRRRYLRANPKKAAFFDEDFLQNPLILAPFLDHDDDFPVFLALDENVWVQLAGPSSEDAFDDASDDTANAGILLKADVVLSAKGFTSWRRSREEREAHIQSVSRPLSRSRLQDAAFALLPDNRDETTLTTSEKDVALTALLFQLVPAEQFVEKTLDELQETSNIVCKNRSRRREQGVLHWRQELVFCEVELILTLVSSTGAQLNEALLSKDGHLVRAGLRPQPRSILRALKELISTSTTKIESEVFVAQQARAKGEP
ncbi:MAG: hypothetical protein GY822_24450 [Deltaproteobacteria bacterium]|nr:hypothetical protein [Deltaproteobacteria bacterium]